jgi:hypothetical protein
MDAEDKNTSAALVDRTVHLSEHRDGWEISATVSRGRVFHSDHRDKQTALVTAIATAVAARGELLIRTNRHGATRVRADQMAIAGPS